MKRVENKIVEKRKSTRFKPLLKVEYKIKKQAAGHKEALVSDISGMGMKIYTSEYLDQNKKMVIFSKDRQGLKLDEALCVIRWARRLGKNRFEAGVEFENIKDAKLFVNWICEKMLDIGFYPK